MLSLGWGMSSTLPCSAGVQCSPRQPAAASLHWMTQPLAPYTLLQSWARDMATKLQPADQVQPLSDQSELMYDLMLMLMLFVHLCSLFDPAGLHGKNVLMCWFMLHRGAWLGSHSTPS